MSVMALFLSLMNIVGNVSWSDFCSNAEASSLFGDAAICYSSTTW